MKNRKLRNSARGQDCTVRIPGVCNFDPATTVLAHINGGGMGMKNENYLGSFTCSACHDMIDGRAKSSFSKEQVKLWHWEGVERTWAIWIKMGLITINE